MALLDNISGVLGRSFFSGTVPAMSSMSPRIVDTPVPGTLEPTRQYNQVSLRDLGIGNKIDVNA